MYEFLAPWGVLIPALSALTAHAATAGLRRRLVLRAIRRTSFPVGVPPLSLDNG